MAQAVNAYQVGTLCWFADKDAGFIGGEVTSKTVDGEEVTLEFKDEKDKVGTRSDNGRENAFKD
jgi:myosin-5